MASLMRTTPEASKTTRACSYSRFWAGILIWATRRCPHG